MIPEGILGRVEMVVLDSDGVCIPRGTTIEETEDGGLYTLHLQTHLLSPQMTMKIRELSQFIKVMISSGRSLLYLQMMYRGILGDATLMAENGSVAMTPDGKLHALVDLPPTYHHRIGKIRWEIGRLPGTTVEPKMYILTIHSPEEYPEVYDIVRSYDSEGDFQIMWNGEAFDIQLAGVSKGTGIETFSLMHGIPTDNIIAIGDRVNDRALLDAVGIPVSADIEELEAPYWTVGDGLPGEELVDFLLDGGI